MRLAWSGMAIGALEESSGTAEEWGDPVEERKVTSDEGRGTGGDWNSANARARGAN